MILQWFPIIDQFRYCQLWAKSRKNMLKRKTLINRISSAGTCTYFVQAAGIYVHPFNHLYSHTTNWRLNQGIWPGLWGLCGFLWCDESFQFCPSCYSLKWVKSYLLHREQFIGIDGSSSSTRQVLSGVLESTCLNMFADDIALYKVIKSTAHYSELQNDINKVSTFMNSKHLQFNVTKC